MKIVKSPRMLTRRSFLGAAVFGAAALAAGPAAAQSLYGDDFAIRDPSLFPPPESPIDFEIEQADLSRIPEPFHRQLVAWHGWEGPGAIVVDPQHRFLYHVHSSGDTATRYGVGVGRQGFAWSGEAVVGMKRRWPRWIPPETMVYRDEKAQKWVNGMPGGPDNPLGARALYLHADGRDTLYRIHGTNEPQSIGKAMSSGCIRMLNQDVAHLYEQVEIGTQVIVLGPDSGEYLLSSR